MIPWPPGYRVVAEALIGADDDELDAHPAPGKWSAREVVHHLADSEMTAATRLRLLVGTDNPQIFGYNQDEFVRKLYYDRPIEASLQAFGAARACTVPFLERLTPAEWDRVGTHSESGAYSVDKWLQIYAVHAHNHADQIRRARAAVSR